MIGHGTIITLGFGMAYAVFMACAAAAQSLGAWEFGEVNSSGARFYQAAISAKRQIASGDARGGYVPVFNIACRENDPQHWQQRLSLDDPLTARGRLSIAVTIDNEAPFNQPWVVTGDKKSLILVSPTDVARLDRARRLKFDWNWGWSWLWLSDSAEFDLGDVHAVIFALSKSCGIPMPQ